MRRLAAVLLLAAFVTAGCEAGLDAPVEAELSLRTRTATEVLPAGARYVGKVDLVAARSNPNLDPFAPGRMDLDAAGDESALRLRAFLDATGFDPATDIREVYVAVEEHDGEETPSLAVYAAIDRDRIVDYVEGEMGAAFERATYRDVPVFTARENGEEMVLALASDELIVASPSVAAVHAMLDRLADGGRALGSDDDLMRLVRQAGGGAAWFVVRGVEAPHGGGASEMDALGRAVEDFAVSLTPSAGGVDGYAVMTARAGVSSDDLARLTKGAVAAMKSAAKDGDDLRALDDVEVRAAGDDVRVSFKLDNAMLAQID